MSDSKIYEGAAIPFSFSRQNGQPLDVTSVMRTLADITTYAANTEKKYVPYEGQTIACLEDKMLYILELKNGVLVPKLSGGVKLIKKDDNVELTDDAALSALRSVKEIEARAISRTKRDTAAEVIEFAKGLTAGGGKTTVSGDGKITTLNLLVQALAETYDLNVSHVATMIRTIIKDYVSSEAFTPGLLGEGFKISKALNGDWNLEIDNVVVRKVMTIFEMIISKIRSVNGGLVISDGNGRIKSVAETTGSPAYYVIGIEGDMQFVVDDYVRCQVFNGGQAKFYWVRVSSISNNSILVLKSEFTNGVVPAVGDDLVQMGNATNKARQGLIYLTASEDGKPRISVMDGINSTSTVGKNKVILGCLDGITDTDFPADFQPSGYGLYAMNVFLKGIFVLRNGKSAEGEIEAAQNAANTAQAKADMITRLFQEFTVAGGVFESKITEVKEYADGKVNAVQVGGRNLIKNSQSLYMNGTDYAATSDHSVVNLDGQMVGKVSRKAAGSSETCYWYAFYTNNMSTSVKPNTTYVWSLDVRSNCDGNAFFDIRNKYNSQFRVRFKSTNDKWIRIFGTMNVADLSIADKFSLFLVGVNGLNVGDYVYYRNPMIVEGNKSTDWTPAPEDVTADAQAKANAAQAAAEAVAIAKATLAKTEASAYADGIVTAEERRAIADAQAKLAEAKLDAQNKADAAKQAAINDAAGKYPTKTEVSTSITQLSNSISLKANQTEVTGLDNRLSSAEAKITPDAIRLTVSEQTKNIAIEYANLAAKLAGAKMLYRDPTFKIGLNGIGVYNNLGNGTVGISRLGRDPNNPTDSNYQLVITSTGHSQTPGRGGFYFSNYVHIYGEYVCKIIAWIPVGSNLCFASNSIGDGGYQKWLTPTVGQGKWTEYVSYVRGGSGNTSSTNFYYLDAGAETLQWWLCYATVFECSSAEDTPTRSEVSAELDILSTEIRAKVSNDTFNALGNRVSAAEATLTVQATQIASKVSQSDFNTLGQRVGSAESAILQQADQISLKASKSDLNTLSGRVSSTEAELLVHANQIGMKVTAGDVSAGMTITANKITLFGKEFDLTGKITFSSMASDAQGKINDAQNAANAAGAAAGTAQNTANKAITDAANAQLSATSANAAITNLTNSLGGLAYSDLVGLAKLDTTIIEGGYIKTNLINATAIVTSVLAATNVTATNLTVTGNSKIAGFKISGDGLTNDGFNNDAYVILRNDNPSSKTFVGIGANIFPSSFGVRALAKFEYSDNSSYPNSAISLFARCRPGTEHPWYTQRAIWYDGNVFGVGKRATFEDGYIGVASTDAITSNFASTHLFIFSSIPYQLTAVDLPSKTQIDKEAGKSNVSFELTIIVRVHITYSIRLKGNSGGYILNNKGEVVSSDVWTYGCLDLSNSDVVKLRYENGHYYVSSDRR